MTDAQRAYMREWRRKNRVRVNAAKRVWQRKNYARIKTTRNRYKDVRYREKNKDAVRASQKRYVEKNKDKIRAERRSYYYDYSLRKLPPDVKEFRRVLVELKRWCRSQGYTARQFLGEL
jgi:hypothetical protein